MAGSQAWVSSWPYIPAHNCVPCCLRTQLACRSCQHLLSATGAEASPHAGEEQGAAASLITAVALASSIFWDGKAVQVLGEAVGKGRHWQSDSLGSSSASMAKLCLACASEKLKCNPAPLQQLSWERLCVLSPSLSFREQEVVWDMLLAQVSLDLVPLLEREMLCRAYNIQK